MPDAEFSGASPGDQSTTLVADTADEMRWAVIIWAKGRAVALRAQADSIRAKNKSGAWQLGIRATALEDVASHWRLMSIVRSDPAANKPKHEGKPSDDREPGSDPQPA